MVHCSATFYVQQEGHANQYASGICCQLKMISNPEYEVVPFTCQTREGALSTNINLPWTISCEQGETLVSCGIDGWHEIQGTYIEPNDPNTYIVDTSSASRAVTAIANCCVFPTNSIYSVNTIISESQINDQVFTKCPIGLTLTGCQVNYQTGATNNIRGSHPGPQQDTNTPPIQFGTEGIDTGDQCIAEAQT